MEKTLSNLRKECKDMGITVKKKTFSWGPTIIFTVNDHEIHSTSVYPEYFIRNNKDKLETLEKIKARYYGMEIDGERVVGLKPSGM